MTLFAVSCRVSMYGDSTITMTNFPIAQLAEHISNPNLAKALAKEAPRTITGKYQVAPNSTSAMAYFLACPSVIELNLTYGTDNKSHKVQFAFAPNQNVLWLLHTERAKTVRIPVLSCPALG